jgi:hypothetical protein
MRQDEAAFLELVREARIGDLLKGSGGTGFEASGVHLKDGYLHIIFDDSSRLFRLRSDWWLNGEDPVFLDLKGTAAGYEDITYHPSTRRWYCLIEAAETKPGTLTPRVDEFDQTFVFIRSFRLEFPLKAGNKGFEGLTAFHDAGDDYLLGLCEGNGCKTGSAGARPGKGRIQVFKRRGQTWRHAGTIRLPETVRFKDYSSLEFRNGTLTVISQASSALWVGCLRGEEAIREDPFEDHGRLFLFPRDGKGRIVYCNVEGVTWLSDDILAVVSDRAKAGQPGRCARKDQSVHVFRLPPGVN